MFNKTTVLVLKPNLEGYILQYQLADSQLQRVENWHLNAKLWMC